MAHQEEIYPECNVDTNLMGFIIGCRVKHKHTCNEVAKILNSTDGFAIGVVDNDKRQATFDNTFQEYTGSASYNRKHVSFYPNTNGKKFLFKITKAMDEFIFDVAKDMNVDLSALGYPKTLNEFKKITKTEDAADNPKLRKLFAEIITHPELQAFRNTIKYLAKKKLSTDIIIAEQFFDGKLTSDDLAEILNDRV